jgi:predicted extracellular nuclease
MQDPRGADAPGYVDGASSGVYVFTSSAPAANLQPGTSVSVDGNVTEFHPGSGGLGITEIGGPTVTVVDPNAGPITPTEIGPDGVLPPATVIDDDAAPGQQVNVETGGQYQPDQDGIDFWESYEGMLVDLPDARVVGPTNTGFGETPIVPAGSGTATDRGGIVLLQDDPNPERIVLDDSTGVTVPAANVGDTYDDAVGNVSYDFGNFHLMASAPPTRTSGGITREVTAPSSNGDLSVATFNVENLDPTDPQSKFDALAEIVVDNLQSPDLLALEEVQDNNGATDDGTVAANQTLDKLITAISNAGGPAYDYRQINPVNDAEGGEPGGNIRVAFLIQQGTPLSFVDRAAGSSTEDTDVVVGADGTPELTHSPGRVAPASSAWAATRVPLAGEFTFGGQKVFVVANHWSSKGGDQGLYGANQPPLQSSEAKRVQQAQAVNDFVDEIYAKDPNANVVVLGDLNDFEYSDSVTTLTDDGDALLDLPSTLPDSQRYTYVFDGNSQVLDHILLSQGLVDQTYDYDVVHVNAEFSQQASDHDPQIVSLHLGLAASELSASANPTPVVYGSSSTVSGVLTDDAGQPIAGATVSLQSRPAGSGSFSDTGATRTTGANGGYSFAVSPTANTEYRVVFGGDRTYEQATSSTVRVDVATRVSVTPGSTTVKRGGSTQLAGVVAPNHAGQTVQIQRLEGTTWTTIGTATLDEDSFYSYVVTIGKKDKKGTTSFRVVKPADADHVVGTSRTVVITVT